MVDLVFCPTAGPPHVSVVEKTPLALVKPIADWDHELALAQHPLPWAVMDSSPFVTSRMDD